MKFNFDEIIDRRDSNSLKWDVNKNELPMWVADMDFRTAPKIIEEVLKCAQKGIYGYSVVTEKWYEAIINWWKTRYDFDIEKQWLQFSVGSMAAVIVSVQRLSNMGDNVVVQTPVYNAFFNSIENHGRHVLENKLIYNGNSYSIDFYDLEEKLSNPLTTLMILCNPHNPVGKIWSCEELHKIGELCKKYGVTVVSDELHCDLTDPGCKYIPFASVSDTCKDISVTCISTSKSFNLAGLQSAAVVIPNEFLRDKMVRGLNSNEMAEPNIFAVSGAAAAYTYGGDWIDELRKYIYNNKVIVNEFLTKEIPDITLTQSNATYLLWINCQKVSSNVSELCKFIRKNTGLYLSDGAIYRGNGSEFVRMNIACPKDTLLDGLSRFKQGIVAYKSLEKNENIPQ